MGCVRLLSLVVWCTYYCLGSDAASTQHELNEFSVDFFQWRSTWAPISFDDLPRVGIERPLGWSANTSKEHFDELTADYEAFRMQLENIRLSSPFDAWDVDDQADYFGLTSALARCFWELHILRPHMRDPTYYVQQSLGAVWDALVQQLPSELLKPKKEELCAFHQTKSDQTRESVKLFPSLASTPENSSTWNLQGLSCSLLPRLRSVPAILQQGRAAMLDGGECVRAYAQVALSAIGGVEGAAGAAIEAAVQAAADDAHCTSSVCPPLLSALKSAAGDARAATESFAVWLNATAPLCANNASIGEGAFLWYMHHVSFINITTERVYELGVEEAALATTALELQVWRNNQAGVPPPPPPFSSIQEQQQATQAAQAEVQEFLTSRQLLSLPPWLPEPAYTVSTLPPWLSPLNYSQLGEVDNWGLASPPLRPHARDGSRGGSRGFHRWVPQPAQGLPFFLDILARDPRPLIVHEGVPGHWCQFTLSQQGGVEGGRDVRRRWLDSTANEGIGFYMEDMTLQAGLYDDRPRTRETLRRMQRLRAVRAQVDAGLATGKMTPAAASSLLQAAVPLSAGDADAEVEAKLQAPGQGLSYTVGKAQVLKFVQLLRQPSEPFNWTVFHDNLLLRGNLPLPLHMHIAGVQKIPSDFHNLHTAFPGVPSSDVPALARVEDRVRALPGAPASSGSSHPLLLSGYLPINSDRSLYYLLVHADKATNPGGREQ